MMYRGYRWGPMLVEGLLVARYRGRYWEGNTYVAHRLHKSPFSRTDGWNRAVLVVKLVDVLQPACLRVQILRWLGIWALGRQHLL